MPRLGEKTFEQAPGFLRVMDGDNPLDASAVHPESYPVAERILADLKLDLKALAAQPGKLKAIEASQYADDRFGLPTIRDILRELEKPGRDPRPEFTTAAFKEGVETLADLKPGMLLEGVVTNVAAFGAFVDIGVHQDGLVHISALADRYVKDPHSVVKAGQVVKVKVLEVDDRRKRIALTMRLTDSAQQTDAGRWGLPAATGRAVTHQRGDGRSVRPAQDLTGHRHVYRVTAYGRCSRHGTRHGPETDRSPHCQGVP